MIRNLLKSAFILALLTLFFWLTDEKSQLNFTFNGTVYAFKTIKNRLKTLKQEMKTRLF